MTSPPKLCPSTLSTHDRRSQRQSQQLIVNSWVASQSEIFEVLHAIRECPDGVWVHSPATVEMHQQSTGTNALPGYVGDIEKQDHSLTTPAIVLTEPDKGECLAKELVAPQLHPHHDKLRTHDDDDHLQKAGRSSHCQSSSTTSRMQPSPSALLGMGGRKLYSGLSLVDQPIMEEPEEEEEEEEEEEGEEEGGVQEEEEEKEEGGRRGIHMKLGGTESGIEERAERLDLENRVFSALQSTQGQVPVVMDEPLPEVPAMLLQPRNKRSRAMSFPFESPAQYDVPLLELPSQNKQPQPNQPDVNFGDRDVMESSMSLKPSKSANVSRFAQVAIMAKKWKKRSADTVPVDEQQNSKKALSSKQKKRPFVEVPRAFKLDLLEEAYQIVNKTYQMYRSQLGPHHKLTLQAKEHLDNLTIQLGNHVLKQ